MATNIDLTLGNESFSTTNMKPGGGGNEEINALWGQKIAANTGHLASLPQCICTLVHWRDTGTLDKPLIYDGAAHSGDVLFGTDKTTEYETGFEFKFYKPASHDRLKYYWLVYGSADAVTVYIRHQIDPDGTPLNIDDNVAVTVPNTWRKIDGDADISSLSTGWHFIRLEIMTSANWAFAGLVWLYTMHS